MKKNVLAIFALATLSLTACKKNDTVNTQDQQEVTAPSADAVTYNVDSTSSQIDWEGGKITGDKHTGTIVVKTGTVAVVDNKVTNGTFEIDMNSIVVTDIQDVEKKAMLEGHLKGVTDENADHFFNVSKYPTAKFEITSVTEENGTTMIEGNLTIKEITKSIKFPATITVSDADVTITTEQFAINRTDFEVNYGSKSKIADLAADQVINDDIKIKLSVKAVK